jgi:chromosome segregation ATPase
MVDTTSDDTSPSSPSMGTTTTDITLCPSKKRASSSPVTSDPIKRRRSDAEDSGSHNHHGEIPSTEEESPDPIPLVPYCVNEAGKPPEAGVITKIYAENFMCHRKFTIELCRNVNFIHGQNGSGKSAILAAIQICLGSGARRTNRARNLKDLVRKDASSCASARIQVTLLNGGGDGYSPEIYGDTITVERTIASGGGYNGYKLYDEKMQEQSRSKKDLDDMLDKLNIQVENPVAILDQEAAKKFMLARAEDKYAFFMKATELERIDSSSRDMIKKKEGLDNQSLRMRSSLTVDMELVAETKKAYEQHEEIEKMAKKLRGYERGYAWAKHGEADAILEEDLDVSIGSFSVCLCLI